MKTSVGEKIFTVFNTILLLFVGLITLYPFIYMLALSFNEGVDATKGGIYLFPRVFTLFNYQMVLSNPLIVSGYTITIGRTILGTAASIMITALVAYGLSFRNLPYRRVIMLYILVPMLFNGGIVPFYLQLKNLHLIDKFWVYIVPFLFGIWNMFVMNRFFMDIPESLRESAYIDGANQYQILFRIIFPVSLPMLAALSLFTAVGHWNDWFSGAFYVTNMKLIPIQTFLQQMLQASDLSVLLGSGGNANAINEEAVRNQSLSKMTLTSVKMATVMVSTLPILCIYPFLQKYFAKGVLVGSVKG